jgi:hypothetical protein
MSDPVHVLIIRAGASGAAVAWSLAETKVHILWLGTLFPQGTQWFNMYSRILR